MSWLSERQAAFEAMLAEWPNTLIHNGRQWDCIATPVQRSKELTPGPYVATRAITFSMRSSDFSSSGIAERNTVRNSGIDYEVISITIDTADAHVDFDCQLKQ